MYNEELKVRFIRDKASGLSTEKMYITVFNITEPYETMWGADICTKSGDDLRQVLGELVGLRSRNRWQKVSVLRDYCNWCIMAGIPGAVNGLTGMDKTLGLDKVRNTTVSSPAHLQSYLDKIFQFPESEETIDNAYRCYCWMAYGGIAEHDITDIKCDQVDFDEMVIHYGKKDIPIYREAVMAFKKAVKLSSFNYIHPNYGTVRRDRADGDTIVRGFKPITYKTMRIRLSRNVNEAVKSGDTKIQLSYRRLWISGLFYRIHEDEQMNGIPCDFEDAAADFMEGKEYDLSGGRNTIDSVRRKIASEYKQDYDLWKLVWY